MRLLIIVPQPDGAISQAEAHDVANEATWVADGGLLLEDGRLHVYPAETLLFSPEFPVIADVLAWATVGKYVIAAGGLVAVDGWQPPAAAPPPEPPPEPEV